MKSNIIPFHFHTREVRAFPTDDGLSFWVVAKDVTDTLGYREAKDGLRLVPDHHKGRHQVPTLGGAQEMLCIDEAGLYRLILRSNKPEAEPFMEWVTAEVLPAIRRTGIYKAVDPSFDETGIPTDLNASFWAMRTQARKMKELLFKCVPQMKRIQKYKVAQLSNVEIGRIIGKSPRTVGRLINDMAGAGLFQFSAQMRPSQSKGKKYPKAKIPVGPGTPSKGNVVEINAPAEQATPDLFGGEQ